MFTILRNLVFNEIRRQKRKPTTSADAIEEEGGAILFLEGSQSPDAALQQTELQQAVDDAIAALPEKARLAVQLRRFENMPYEEIAKTLEMTVPATKAFCSAPEHAEGGSGLPSCPERFSAVPQYPILLSPEKKSVHGRFHAQQTYLKEGPLPEGSGPEKFHAPQAALMAAARI